MTAIEQLAVDLLDDNAYDASSLVEEIIPVYWERVGNRERTLFPDNIYRHLWWCLPTLSTSLAAINVPSKHFDAYIPTHWLNERAFSVFETSCALVMMRKLSMQLFAILNKTNHKFGLKRIGVGSIR